MTLLRALTVSIAFIAAVVAAEPASAPGPESARPMAQAQALARATALDYPTFAAVVRREEGAGDFTHPLVDVMEFSEANSYIQFLAEEVPGGIRGLAEAEADPQQVLLRQLLWRPHPDRVLMTPFVPERIFLQPAPDTVPPFELYEVVSQKTRRPLAVQVAFAPDHSVAALFFVEAGILFIRGHEPFSAHEWWRESDATPAVLRERLAEVRTNWRYQQEEFIDQFGELAP